MPTAIPSGEKSAFIAIVNAAPYPGGPRRAAQLQTTLVNYEDIFNAITRQLSLFVGNNSYLTEAMKVFTDSALVAVGIWNGKTTAPTTSVEPICIINSTITTNIQLTASTNKVLAIIGNSTITQVTLASNTIINELYVGPGSTLNYLIGTLSGVLVKLVRLPFAKSAPSSLFAVAYGTKVNSVDLAQGSYFGGFTNIDPATVCSTPVTSLSVGTVTHNSVPLTWTSPNTSILFINTYYRKQGELDWIQGTEAMGEFNGNSGYTFTCLNPDTVYEFRVIVVCTNGGWSTPVVTNAQTTCCK